MLEPALELNYTVVFREDKQGVEWDANKHIFHYDLDGGVSWRHVSSLHRSCWWDGDDSIPVIWFACASSADGRMKFGHGHVPGTAFGMDMRSMGCGSSSRAQCNDGWGS